MEQGKGPEKGRYKMRVMGIKVGSFNDQATGKLIEYCHLHVADEDKNVKGEAVEVLKISASLIDEVRKLAPGNEIKVAYNKFGRVETISKVS